MFRFGIVFVFIRLGLRLGLGARAGILRLDGDACDLLAAFVRVGELFADDSLLRGTREIFVCR